MKKRKKNEGRGGESRVIVLAEGSYLDLARRTLKNIPDTQDRDRSIGHSKAVHSRAFLT